MAATFKDMDQLRQDGTFQGRVRMAVTAACLGASNEAWSVPFHRERQMFAVNLLNAPDDYVSRLASAIATDATVIADATNGGTVSLSPANVSTQAALVTDAHITAAFLAQINGFLKAPFA